MTMAEFTVVFRQVVTSQGGEITEERLVDFLNIAERFEGMEMEIARAKTLLSYYTHILPNVHAILECCEVIARYHPNNDELKNAMFNTEALTGSADNILKNFYQLYKETVNEEDK